jgi:hypothetical protein
MGKEVTRRACKGQDCTRQTANGGGLCNDCLDKQKPKRTKKYLSTGGELSSRAERLGRAARSCTFLIPRRTKNYEY